MAQQETHLAPEGQGLRDSAAAFGEGKMLSERDRHDV